MRDVLGAAAAAAAGRAKLPARAGLPVVVRQLLHRQLVVAVRRVLQPDTGHVPVAGALPLRRGGGRALPARAGARPGAGAAA